MQTMAQRALRLYLWFIAAFHLFVGLSVNMSQPFTRLIAAWYGATVDWTPQFVYILRPLGAFMIILGLLAGFIARALLPGDQPGGIIVTALVGIAGALIFGFLAQAIGFGDPIDEFFDFSTWVAAILGAVVLLLIWSWIAGRRTT